MNKIEKYEHTHIISNTLFIDYNSSIDILVWTDKMNHSMIYHVLYVHFPRENIQYHYC